MVLTFQYKIASTGREHTAGVEIETKLYSRIVKTEQAVMARDIVGQLDSSRFITILFASYAVLCRK